MIRKILLLATIFITFSHADNQDYVIKSWDEITKDFVKHHERDEGRKFAVDIVLEIVQEYMGSDFSYTPKLEEKMFQYAHQKCLKNFSSKMSKDGCVGALHDLFERHFRVQREVFEREQLQENFKAGKNLICDFSTIKSNKVRMLLNNKNSQLYKQDESHILVENYLFDILNCQLERDTKKDMETFMQTIKEQNVQKDNK